MSFVRILILSACYCWTLGLWISGLLPLVHELLATRSSYAIALFLLGLAFGQLVVYPSQRVQRSAYALSGVLLTVGGSTALLASDFSAPTLLLSVTLQGIAFGTGLCLVYQRAESINHPFARSFVSVYNALLGMGFLFGGSILLSLISLFGRPQTLLIFSCGVGLLGVAFWRQRATFHQVPSNDTTDAILVSRWLERYAPHFLSKMAFIFALATAVNFVPEYVRTARVDWIIITLYVFFVLVQRLLPKVGLSHWRISFTKIPDSPTGLTLFQGWSNALAAVGALLALKPSYGALVVAMLFLSFIMLRLARRRTPGAQARRHPADKTHRYDRQP